MTTALIVTCQQGESGDEYYLKDWLPGAASADLFVALDPLVPPPPAWQGNAMHHTQWVHEGQLHDLYVTPPFGTVQPLEKWRSDSVQSAAFYPWFFNLCEDFSNCPFDIMLQLLPQGETSHHYHQQTSEERYFPLLPDGGTMMRRGSNSAVPLRREVAIPAGEPHQLIRTKPGFSLQLLWMNGPVRFPCRSDHLPVTQKVLSTA
jgi:hypothetical protein